jgi:hypothetical protein
MHIDQVAGLPRFTYNQNHMANTAIGFGIAFILLGLAGYFGTGMISMTALIPAAFGIVFCLLGLIARDPDKRKHAMHAAAALGVIAFLGSGRGLTKIWPLLAGEPVERPSAVIAQALMALLSLIFVALCVKSFIDARRSRIAT